MFSRSLLLGGMLPCLALGCGDRAAGVAEIGQRVIHGQDDRQDVDALGPGIDRDLAIESAVALVPEAALRDAGDGRITFMAATLGDVFQLCATERFASQPCLAECSGVLVDGDLLLTAAHCLNEPWPCERQLWAFGYALADPARPLELAAEDLYRCRAVPVRRYETDDDGRIFDYALIQLDRPVTARRRPATLAAAAPLAGETLTVIGYPDGLPVKIDAGAAVLDARESTRDYLVVASDTFEKSSGSGVFDEQGGLLAVFARGALDYEYRPEGDCFAARRVSDDETPGEQASYAAPAIEDLCAAGWPSQALCKRAGRCGDGQCALDEHDGGCDEDCPDLAWRLPESAAPAGCSFSRSSQRSGLDLRFVAWLAVLLRSLRRVGRHSFVRLTAASR